MIIDTNRKPKYYGYYLYVLELEDGKYYVGLSHNVSKRCAKHKSGKGAEWTKLHKPLKIIMSEKTGFYSYREAGLLENKKTLELMKKYGKYNVRGGEYCAVNEGVLDSLIGDKLSNTNGNNLSKKKEATNYKKKNKKKSISNVKVNKNLNQRKAVTSWVEDKKFYIWVSDSEKMDKLEKNNKH